MRSFGILSDCLPLTSIGPVASRQMRCIWPDKQHDSSSDRSMFKTSRVMEDVFLYNAWSLTYVRFRDRYTRRNIVQRYRAKMRNETFKVYASASQQYSYHKSMSVALKHKVNG